MEECVYFSKKKEVKPVNNLSTAFFVCRHKNFDKIKKFVFNVKLKFNHYIIVIIIGFYINYPLT